ncbi:G-patch domain [Dillenia turbinata]|uniref:G-patch domain n=1 Tax=Dillenia turbinata TaxID=194707 RepID=A0AAN8V2I3_9MAGN
MERVQREKLATMTVNRGEETSSSTSATAIDSSNIGFQLLKKHGWKEGTGLGIAEQGRLEPVETYVKKNKRGLGADRIKKTTLLPHKNSSSEHNDASKESLPSKSKTKAASKRIKKIQEKEKQLQEKEFERAFFREFWPDNV